ncbi:MAG: MMPL family transporter [Thermosipho sp. (in: Bacteria)]|nr:MMPL family transporter [Thermosipho sp. (in: thermotogales)]
MKKLGDFVIKHSKKIFIILMIITLISLVLTFTLTMRPGFLDLLPENDPYVQVYRDAVKSFKSVDTIIIGISGNKNDIVNYIENVSKKLKEIDYIEAVLYKNPMDFISKNVFLLVEGNEVEFLKKLYSSTNLVDFISALNVMFSQSESQYKMNTYRQKQFEIMLSKLEKLFWDIKNVNLSFIDSDLSEMLFGEKYFLSDNGNFGVIIIRPTISSDDIEKTVELVNNVESIVKGEAKKYNVQAGLTGTMVIARDEMVTTEKDMAISTTVSLILIILIFLIGFRSLKYMFLSVVPLLLGIIWALGFTKISIGSLNIMTVMMGAIIAGLGIDYSIHINSLFIELRSSGLSIVDSLKGVFEKNIRGIIAGAVTTAIGLGIFAISSFPGFREFGIVLSAGIIFTLLTAIFGLTILLKKFGKKFKDPGNAFVVDYNIKRYRIISLVILATLLILSFVKIPSVEFDKNMMNIEAKGLESIALNQKMLEEFGFSPDNTIFINDNLDEARRLYNVIKNEEVFSEIDSIIQFLPEPEKQLERLNIVKEIKSINAMQNDELNLAQLKTEINKLSFNIAKSSVLLKLLGYKGLSEKLQEILNSGIIVEIAKKSLDDLIKVQGKIVSTVNKLRSSLNGEEIITIDNLPEDLKGNYVGGNNKILTIAYSNGDIWNADYQKEYFKTLEKLNLKNVSGSALVFLRVIQISAREGAKVLILTIIFIFIVLIFDMKSLKYAVIAMLPMLLSIILLLGVMGWFGIKFNVVNIIALPLIIGIGVDDGIHLIHRYRREKNLRLSLKSTGKAITMTTLTTGAAFGSFILAKYRGFVGFGLLLLLGVVFSYLITVFVVTSLISYIDKVE